jgi:uncharacterized protein YjbI with pentapeptide repeats
VSAIGRLWPVWLVAAAAVIVGVVLWAAFVQPPWLLDTRGLAGADLAKARNDFRGTMLTALAGMAVLVGAVVGALNLHLTSRQNRAVLELQRRGQVTERFSKAIEQLGESEAEKLDVRIGAVYALEQIARDSAELHWPIMEVLTAHLRHFRRAPPATFAAAGPTEAIEDAKAPAEAQAIATVIGRRKHEQDPPKQRLDLHDVDLSHIVWPRDTNLERANLGGARLVKANLVRAHLNSARAHLDGAVLSVAHLTETALSGAHLRRAELDAAHLQGAELEGAHLEGAILIGARLEKAYLVKAHLEGANLTGAQLREADLREAELDDADLARVDLRGVRGLTWPQIQKARNVDRDRLPPSVRDDVSAD